MKGQNLFSGEIEKCFKCHLLKILPEFKALSRVVVFYVSLYQFRLAKLYLQGIY